MKWKIRQNTKFMMNSHCQELSHEVNYNLTIHTINSDPYENSASVEKLQTVDGYSNVIEHQYLSLFSRWSF